VLGRSAYCENALEKEKRLGCSQYVLFASGYDTFAIRNRDDSLAMYELDIRRPMMRPVPGAGSNGTWKTIPNTVLACGQSC